MKRVLPALLIAGLSVAAACSEQQPPIPRGASVAVDGEALGVKPKLLGWNDLLSRPRPKAQHTVSWGAGATDVVDVWLPEGAGPHPVVLMVHGGCWQKSIADRTLMDWAAEDLRAQGLAVWNIEYRGVDEAGGGYPGTFLDVARAADAMRAHAGEFGLDLTRVAAFGHSAGGHLAMWLAARPKLPRNSPMWMEDPLKLVGVVNSGGLADLKASAPVTQRDCLGAIMGDLVGDISSERADVFSDTSPVSMFPLRVRQVSVNGEEDGIAPALLGEDITRKARAAGDRAEVIVVPATGHVELVAPGTVAFGREVEVLKGMLR